MQIPDFEHVTRELRRRDPRLYILERRVGIDVARIIQSFLPLGVDGYDLIKFVSNEWVPENGPVRIMQHQLGRSAPRLKRLGFHYTGNVSFMRAYFAEWLAAAEKYPELVTVAFEKDALMIVKWYSF